MTSAVPPEQPGPSPAPATPFVGRERELAELSDALARVAAGQGQVVLLVGEPGIGKTRTAEELVAQARARGLVVLWGRANEWEGAPPYWPWVQLLRAYLRGRASDDPRAVFGSGAAEIAQIVPELRECLPETPAPPQLEPEQARFRLFDSITSFFKRVAEPQP